MRRHVKNPTCTPPVEWQHTFTRHALTFTEDKVTDVYVYIAATASGFDYYVLFGRNGKIFLPREIERKTLCECRELATSGSTLVHDTVSRSNLNPHQLPVEWKLHYTVGQNKVSADFTYHTDQPPVRTPAADMFLLWRDELVAAHSTTCYK